MRTTIGLERLSSPEAALLRGKRVGLVTNHTGLTPGFESSVDALKAVARVEKLYGPEHGIRGDAGPGDHVASSVDGRTGIPVFSLYGESRKPTPEMLGGIDALVFDMQDVGCRFYTYIYTMAYAMEACAEVGLPFVVLDRPDPLGGAIVSGNAIQTACSSFVGDYGLPQRYGLTIGELALYLNGVRGLGCDLSVVRLESWTREAWQDEIGLPWTMPSPNIPTLESALVYSGTCIFEGTNLSEGRGTARPFELIGAPWLDCYATAEAMNRLELPGIRFRPLYFTPSCSKHSLSSCAGVQLHVDPRMRKEAPLLEAAVRLLFAIRDLHPKDFAFLPAQSGGRPFIDLISGYAGFGELTGPEPYLELCREGERAFREARRPYLIYPEA